MTRFTPIPDLAALNAALDLVHESTGGEGQATDYRILRTDLYRTRVEVRVTTIVYSPVHDGLNGYQTSTSTIDYDRATRTATFVDLAAEGAADPIPF